MVACNSTQTSCKVLIHKREFSDAPKVAPEDFLSTLPDDCLLEITQFLNGDLATISTINQRLHMISEDSKKWISKVKTTAHALKLRQGSLGGFLLQAHLPDCNKIVFAHRFGEFYREGSIPYCQSYEFRLPRVDTRGKEMIHSTTPCVFSRMQFLLERYYFSYSITFESVLIDNSFIDHCEVMFASQKSLTLSLEKIAFHTDCDVPKRFVNWIVSRKWKYLSIDGASTALITTSVDGMTSIEWRQFVRNTPSLGLSFFKFTGKMIANANCTKKWLSVKMSIIQLTETEQNLS